MSGSAVHWTRWTPLPDLPARMYVKEFVERDGALVLTLTEGDAAARVLELTFADKAYAYRGMDERYLLELPPVDEPLPWRLHLVEASDYADDFAARCGELVARGEIIHLVASTCDTVMDFLVSALPTVRWRDL